MINEVFRITASSYTSRYTSYTNLSSRWRFFLCFVSLLELYLKCEVNLNRSKLTFWNKEICGRIWCKTWEWMIWSVGKSQQEVYFGIRREGVIFVNKFSMITFIVRKKTFTLFPLKFRTLLLALDFFKFNTHYGCINNLFLSFYI